jgi:hypothetical protein
LFVFAPSFHSIRSGPKDHLQEEAETLGTQKRNTALPAPAP